MDEKFLTVQVGNRLKMLRHSLNLTQSEFAKQIDRTQREVSAWENGKKLIPFAIVFKIKELYSIPIGFFDPQDDSYLGKVLSQTLQR